MLTLDDTALLRLIDEAMALVGRQMPTRHQRLPWRVELACVNVLRAVIALHEARAALTNARLDQDDA